MLINTKDIEAADDIHSDVLIVGAGAVGLATAVKLARAGRDVCVLEAGPASLDSKSQEFFEIANSIGEELNGLHNGRFRVLGGTTNFWGGQLVPFEPLIFQPRTWVPGDAGWPIGAQDLQPFYEETLNLVGLQNCIRDDAEVFRAVGTNLPKLSEDLEIFLSRWIPQPNFVRLFDGELRENNQLRVFVNAPAVAIGMNEAGDRAEYIVSIDRRGRRRRFIANTVVLANGTIEIARLLMLRLADGRKAAWSGNAWLGKGFADHIDCTAGDVFPQDKDAFHNLFDNVIFKNIKYHPKIKLTDDAQNKRKLLGICSHFIFNSSYAEHFDSLKIFARGLMSGRIESNLFLHPIKTLKAVKIGWPMALRYLRHHRIFNPADLGIQLRLSSEQVMIPNSCINLTDRLDALEMPVIEVDWKIDGIEIETMTVFSELVRDQLEQAGLAKITLDPRLVARDPEFLTQIDDGLHHMGAVRMASTSAAGVVDSNLRVFGTSNLHVAGAAVYPSTGYSNPTFTAIALGLRLASQLCKGQAVSCQ